MRTGHKRYVRGGLRPWNWGMEIKGNPQWSPAAHVRTHSDINMCALLHEIEHEGTMRKLAAVWSKG